MNRRTMLRVGGMAALGFGAGACGARGPGAAVRPPRRPAVQLAPVDVSRDRVIRTVVGLRPFRRGGFRVEVEKLDGKTVVHNYGHGGAGVSLSWGTAALAADLALATGERRAAVIGCGAVGLAAARTLQRRGFDVTIYTAAPPPDTTSNIAPAGFTPWSRVIDTDRRTPEFDARYAHAASTAYHAWQHHVGDHYGVRWMYEYLPSEVEPSDDVGDMSQLTPHLRGEYAVLGPGEHPFGTPFTIRRSSLMIETPIYLNAVLRDFLLWGGRLVVRKMEGPRDLVALPDPLIVTCVGLGARELLGDDEMEPVKGQLSVLLPQPEIDYILIPGGGLYMMPRRDGILLGGTGERGVWTLEPNEQATERIIRGHIDMFAPLRAGGGPAPLTTRRDPRPFEPAAAGAVAPARYTREFFLAALDAGGGF